MEEVDRDAWITEVVGGRTFADVGGLWGTVNEKVSVAAAGGASHLTIIDATPFEGDGTGLWRAFQDRCAALGLPPATCLSADVHAADLVRQVGQFDVVHCSGVLYHSPHPVHMLNQLASITTGTLILGTATIPTRVENACGVLDTPSGGAVFVPALDGDQRAILGAFLDEVGARALGINAAVEGGWRTSDYAPWWWLPTAGCVRGMLEVAGFDVQAEGGYWSGRASLFRAIRRIS